MSHSQEIAQANVELGPVSNSSPAPKQDDHYLVTFATPFDAENPKDWSSSKKWTVTDVLSATGFNRIMVSTIMAPALPEIARDLHMNNTESVMAMSIYLLATAVGPLAIGPLSEVYGRLHILHASNVWFLIFNIVCGFAPNKGTLIAARFLAGFGASAIYPLSGGVLGDIWRPEQRGKSLGIYLLIPLLGSAVGPLIGGFMAAHITWRWIFWSTSIFQAAMVVASFLAFHETHGPVILRERAQRKRKETGDQRYYTLAECQDGQRTALQIVARSLSRPMRLLLFHPIVQIIALRSAFFYGILYIVLTTFADLWTTRYHESTQIAGLHYLAIALGETFGAQIGGRLLDVVYRFFKNRQVVDDPASGEGIPEYRIPLMFPGAILTPIGLLIYAWAAQKGVFWLVVDLGIFVMTFAMQIQGGPSQAYIIDAYPEHTSSATAASQFLRSLTAFAFPLFAPAMYKALGYGWGNTTVAILAVVIGIPSPMLLWKYGAQLRARAHSSY